jgi:hypothetical protein
MKLLAAIAITASIVLPYAAFAQGKPADAAYCYMLAAKYRKEVGMNATSSDVPVAISKCDSDSASAIPVLERSLKDNKVALPPRG